MDSEFLIQQLRNNTVVSPYFIPHVFLLNDLSNVNISRLPCSFIVNSITSNQARMNVLGHFTCFFITKNHVYYFDSFAPKFNKLDKRISDFIKHVAFRKQLIILASPYQSKDSCTCGLFCAFMIYQLSQQNRSLSDILSVFHTYNLFSNDVYLVQWFISVFGCNFSRRMQRRLLNCM